MSSAIIFEKEKFLDESKREVLLEQTKKLNINNAEKSIKTYDLISKISSGIKLLLGMQVSKALTAASSSLSLTWTPLSIFLGIAKDASIAHLKHDDLLEKISDLKEMLIAYSGYTAELEQFTQKYYEESKADLSRTVEQDYYDINEILYKIYLELIKMRDFGEEISNALSDLPDLSDKFKMQGTVHSVDIAQHLDFLQLNEISNFNKSLNSIRSLIRMLEN